MKEQNNCKKNCGIKNCLDEDVCKNYTPAYCPANKASPKYDQEWVNTYKEAGLIADLCIALKDVEGVRIRW